MKERLRQKLIMTRNEFLELDDYDSYEWFGVWLNFTPKNDSVIIELTPVAIKNIQTNDINDAINFFSKSEIIGKLKKDKEEFENFARFCAKKYDAQCSFISSTLIDGIYGEGMNIDKFLYVINDLMENNSILLDQISFIITETIF